MSGHIESLEIKNFQGHKHSVFKFHPGINVVVGESDHGKSSALRALIWALTNTPTGDAFRSTFAGKKELTEVSVAMDGKTLTRSKGGDVNQYTFDGEVFKALRSGVPEQIQEFLDLDEHNIQRQFVPYFLLQDTDGEVARKLNQVCKLSAIDDVLSRASSMVTRCKQDETYALEKLVEVRQELGGLASLDKLRPLIQRLEEVAAQLPKVEKQARELEELAARTETAENRLKTTREFIARAEPVYSEAEAANRALLGVSVQVASLGKLITGIQEEEAALADLRKVLQIDPQVCSAEKLATQVTELQTQRTKLTDLVDSVSRADEEFTKAREAAQKAEQAYEQYKEELGVCPLCGGELK